MKHNIAIPAGVVACVIVLWYVPMALGYSHPGMAMAYRNLFDIQNIMSNGYGYISSSSYSYLSWPGFQAVWAFIGNSGIDVEPIMKWFPLAMSLLYLLPLYIFLYNTTGNRKYSYVGLLVFSIANWLGQEYFCPQSAGMLLFLSALAVSSLRPRTETGKWVALTILIILIGITVVTHMLTSLVLVSILTVFCVIRSRKTVMIVAVSGLMLLLCWNVVLDNKYVDAKLRNESLLNTLPPVTTMAEDGVNQDNALYTAPESELLGKSRTAGGNGLITADIDYILTSNILGSISGSTEHRTVVLVRIIYSVFLLLLGLIAATYVMLKRRNRTDIAILASVAVLACFVFLRAGGWELGQRLLMFGLPFLAYFAVSAIIVSTKRKRILVIMCVLVLLCTPAWFVSHYGNQPTDYLSSEYIEGVKKVKQIENDEGYLSIMRMMDVGWINGTMVFGSRAVHGVNYFPISDYDESRYEFLFNAGSSIKDMRAWMQGNGNKETSYCEYELYWSNGEFDIYKGFRAKTQEEWDEYKATTETG